MTREEVLEEAIREQGGEIIRAESHTFDEQIRLFEKADLIVGPHGAGLSNMIWSQDAELLEIFPYSEFNDCYARIARTLGFTYHYLHGKDDGSEYGQIPVKQIISFVKAWEDKDLSSCIDLVDGSTLEADS
jgi:capsular polysaccharide biosynthesis protein